MNSINLTNRLLLIVLLTCAPAMAQRFLPRAATPTFSPTAGTYSGARSVTISTSTAGCSAYIYWNTTGSPTTGDTQGTSVSVTASETVYAKVIGCPRHNNSTVGSAAYTIGSPQAATPTFSPTAGTYSSTQSVTISTSTSGCSAYIYWNTTGTPTTGDTNGTSLSVAASETVYARVIGCPGYTNSVVGSAAYTITSARAATPTFSPTAGTYSSTQSVTIATSTASCSAYIYWNTTGNPTSLDTQGTSVSVASSETVYAKAIGCPGYTDSAVGSAAYTIGSPQAATPTFSPTAGTYSSTQSVTISTSTSGCSAYIYWNTTGNPTSLDTHGTSVNVAASETVYAKVIGCPGYTNSAVGPAAYTIGSPQAAAPTFNPTSGNHSSTQSVTISTSTSGCSAYIYWNITGSPTSGDTQGTSVSVAASETVYAKVIGCPGYTDSVISSAAYTIGGADPTLVQDVAWGTNGGLKGRYFYYHLPSATLGGSSSQGDSTNNLLICGLSYDTTSVTAAITDNQGNSWTTGPSTDDGGRKLTLYYVAGAKQGTQNLMVTLSSAQYYVHFRCSEFYNVEVSSPSDGTAVTTSGSGKAAPTISTSSAINTTADDDLIYYYGIDAGWQCCNTAVSSWTVGSNFNLLVNDRARAHFAEYQVQTTHGAITPTITATGSTDTFVGAAMAFKAHGGFGTAPTGIYIVHEYHYVPPNSGSSAVVQFPCSGNLFVATGSTAPGQFNVTGMTDSNSNMFTRWSIATFPQVFYKQNATCANPNTRTVTFTYTDHGSPDPMVIYDVAGAAAASYDSTMGIVTGTGSQSSKAASDISCANNASYNTTLNATPSTSTGIMFVVENNGQGPECGASGTNNVFDSAWFQTEDDACCGMLDSSSGFMHIPYTSSAQQTATFNWANSAAGGASSYSIAILAFKAP